MLKNYWRTAIRNLKNQKLSTTLNIVGLVSGITASLLIFIHINYELGYDKGYANSEEIYRVVRTSPTRSWAPVSLPLAEEISKFIPKIKKVARFFPAREKSFRYVDKGGSAKIFEEKAGFYLDADALDIFSMEIVQGSTRSFEVPGQILISEEMARRYFGNDEALGKTITDLSTQVLLSVIGVFRKPDFPTHLQFDYLEPMATYLNVLPEEWQQRKNWSAAYTYSLPRQDFGFFKLLEP